MTRLTYPSSFSSIFLSLWNHRSLIFQLTKREVIGRYKGSWMGLLWSFFNPLLMLIVYTFVFKIVFKTRWGIETDGKVDFAIILFAGLIVHSIFSECVNRAPFLILNNVNYVKKVIFPLEVLPWVAMGATLFHSLISVSVLLLFFFILNSYLPLTAILLPVVLLPLVLVTLGCSWFLSSFGVYIRDIGQITGILTMALLFLSPIFYPLSAVPEKIQNILLLNPLTFIVEHTRNVLIWGNAPKWASLFLYFLVSLVVAWLGFAWFQKTRKGFADVL